MVLDRIYNKKVTKREDTENPDTFLVIIFEID